MKQDLLKGLGEEQVAKIRNCKTHEEMLKLAKEEGVELTDEQLEAVSGGSCEAKLPPCPNCQSDNTYLLQGNEFMIKEMEVV